MGSLNDLYANLQWLPPAPPDFAKILKEVGETSANPGHKFQSLASYALDLNQATKLGRAITKAISAERVLQPLVAFRLAILSNSTTELIAPVLVASAARHGIALELVETSYGQVAAEALNPESPVQRAQPNAVLFALDYHALPLQFSPGNEAESDSSIESALAYLRSLRQGIKNGGNALCIFQNFAPLAERLFGSLDRSLPGTFHYQLNKINSQLAADIFQSGDVLLDIAGLAEIVGLAAWHDPQLWNLGKFPFADRFVPLYADFLGRTLGAICGKSRKALVLDLDNTIWSGVIGDDGLEGINIAQGDPVGEAHLALQQFALYLRQRGVILAVSSKNTDEIARQPFEKHPEMLLKLDHIAVFQANWNDKATNIEAIARELSLGLEAMVFLDDNAVERNLVRKLLPQVAVPELPDDPSGYVRTLAAAGYFEASGFAPEDLKRAEFYRDNARRAQLQQQVAGLDAYLASLQMTITFQPFDATGRARIVQLINKSNQFNLTTRRYTDPQIAAAESDPNIFTLQVRLSDVFGDNGMISVVICRPSDPGVWEIDTWLMSCRVLGRRVEEMVLRELIAHAGRAGIRKFVGVYKPTDRNQLVVDHYAKLGFTKTGGEDSGLTRWEFVINESAEPEFAPMRVQSSGFAESQDGQAA